MKKHDLLFKKIELFEKLAVYGDRTKFLNAIAEGATSTNLDSNDTEEQKICEKSKKL